MFFLSFCTFCLFVFLPGQLKNIQEGKKQSMNDSWSLLKENVKEKLYIWSKRVQVMFIMWSGGYRRSPHLGARSKVWGTHITITVLSRGLCNKLTETYSPGDILYILTFLSFCHLSWTLCMWQWNLPPDLIFWWSCAKLDWNFVAQWASSNSHTEEPEPEIGFHSEKKYSKNIWN